MATPSKTTRSVPLADLPKEGQVKVDPRPAGPETYTDDSPLLLLPVRIECRYTATKLRMRVYPDLFHLADHREGLVLEGGLDERALGVAFWEACLAAGFDVDASRSAWDALCAEIAPERAVYVVRTLVPLNLAALRSGARTAPEYPATTTAGPAVTTLWGLPSRWTWVVTYFDGTPKTYTGKTIRRTLQVEVADPRSPSTDTAWLVDFDAAVTAGMALEIDIEGPVRARGLRQIAVFGLSDALAPDLAAQLHAQSAVRGVAFVPGGTPTNNTAEGTSPYTEQWARDARWMEAQRILTGAAATLPSGTAGAQFAAAMGISESEVAHLPGADVQRDALARRLQERVYDELLEPSLELLIGSSFTTDARTTLRAWSSAWVRPDGPLPVLRVGRQAYGLWPVLHPGAQLGTVPATDVQRVVARIAGSFATRVPDPTTWTEGHPLDPLARIAHPGSFVTQAWELRQQTLDRASDIAARAGALPSEATAEDAAVWRATFGALQDWLRDVLVAIEHGAELPPAIATAADALGSYSPSYERDAADSRARALQRDAVERCRSSHVPAIWEEFHEWWTPAGVSARQLAVDDARYKPWLKPAQQEDNRDRTRTELAGLTALGRAVRQLDVWAAAADDVHALLADVDSWFYQDTRRARLLDFIEGAWGDPLAGGDILDAEPRGPKRLSSGKTLRESGMVAGEEFGKRGAVARRPTVRKRILGDEEEILEEAYGAETVSWGVRAAIGSVSTRLDAWQTALATEALAEARERPRATRTKGPGRETIQRAPALRIGAYGFVLSLPKPPDEKDPTPVSEGYVLAPSTAHAATAAVLRSGYLAHAGDEESPPLAVHLSGRRVRTARAILEQVGVGRDAGTVIGLRIEEALHDEGLESAIGEVRRVVMGDDTVPLDGFDTLEALARQHLAEAGHEPGAEGSPELAGSVVAVIDAIAAEVDAVADLQHAEGVHQLLMRRPDRARVALDALTVADPAIPGEWDVLDAAAELRTEQYAIVALEDAAAAGKRPRNIAAPSLDAWLGRWLGPLDRLHVDVHAGDRRGEVSIADLGLGPLDAVIEAARETPLLLRAAKSLGFDVQAPLAWADRDRGLWRLLARDLDAVIARLVPLADDDLAGLGLVARDDTVRRARDAWRLWTDAVAAAADGVELAWALLDTDPAAAAVLAANDAERAWRGAALIEGTAATRARVQPLVDALDGGGDPVEILRILHGGRFPIDQRRSGVDTTPFRDHAPELDLSSVGRVRPAVDALHLATWTADALPGGARAPRIRAHKQPDRIVQVVGPAPKADLVGWRLDSWEEVIPRERTRLGLALHLDAPASQAPNLWMLALPPAAGWQEADIGAWIGELVRWTKLRGVGAAELAPSEDIGLRSGVLPATFWKEDT